MYIDNQSSLQEPFTYPPGLLGDTANYFYEIAPRPSRLISLSAAIAFTAGITGNAYNVFSTGLNQYILMLAPSGMGKDIASSGSKRLVSYIWDSSTGKPFPFAAPEELVSAAGTIRYLEDVSSFNAIIGEFPKQLREMANHKNVVQHGVGRQILKLYSKSGAGDSYGALAYSDKQKRNSVIHAPALTIYGEGTPEEFYEILTPALITDGLLTRFMVFEENGQRPVFNKRGQFVTPDAFLVQRHKDVLAFCLGNQKRRQAQPVYLSPDAEALFDSYDEQTTAFINDANNEVTRQLLNRAHLKAAKLAAQCAIGENYCNPVISLDAAIWAIDLITAQTNSLIAKFENNETGEQAGNDSLQVAYIKRVIAELFTPDSDKAEKYDVNIDMLNHGVIEYAYIWRRLATLKPFQPNPKQSIKATIQLMLESGWLNHVPNELKIKLGTRATCYLMANPAEFANCDCVKDKMQFISTYLALLRL